MEHSQQTTKTNVLLSGLDNSGAVVCEPLYTVPELLCWEPTLFPCGQSKTPLRCRSLWPSQEPKRPKILVCHDMAGGYLNDRYIYGSKEHSYRFYHWHLIDIFVYFSHHFVTVPPVGWIDAAHRHGVPVLGTLITEWEEGAQRCREILRSVTTIDLVTTQLAELAKYFGFDGWLVNIENKIETDHVGPLRELVTQLTQKCHALIPGSQVIWYDSVINTGELLWQDELNGKNKMFFDVCDGIFLNYGITKEKLSNSAEVASEEGRQCDVYAGIDVYGRQSPCGGGFNCKEDLAMILDAGLSCAIFAPGWVYESLDQDSFDDNETMFWGLLQDLIPNHPVSVPVSTSFCQGRGNVFFLAGKAVNHVPWQNLSLQQIQPNFTQSQFVSYSVTKLPVLVNTSNSTNDDPLSTSEVFSPAASSSLSEHTKTQSAEEKEDDNFISVHGENVASEPAETQNVPEKVEYTIKADVLETHPASPRMEPDFADGYHGGSSLKLSLKTGKCAFTLFELLHVTVMDLSKLSVAFTWKLSDTQLACVGLALLCRHCMEGPDINLVATTSPLSPMAQQDIIGALADESKRQDCSSVVHCFGTLSTGLEEENAWRRSTWDVYTMGSVTARRCTVTVAVFFTGTSPAQTANPAVESLHIGCVQITETDDSFNKIVPATKNNVKLSGYLSEAKIQTLVFHSKADPALSTQITHDATSELAHASLPSLRPNAPGFIIKGNKTCSGGHDDSDVEASLSKCETFRVLDITLCENERRHLRGKDSLVHLFKWNFSLPGIAVQFCHILAEDEDGHCTLIGHSTNGCFVSTSRECLPLGGKVYLQPILTTSGLSVDKILLGELQFNRH